MDDIRISVIGTGYVGLVTALTFAEHGFKTTCLDIVPEIVQTINDQRAPFYEEGLEELIRRNVGNGMLRATTDFTTITDTDVSFICVGTPSSRDGSVDLSFVEAAAAATGKAISNKKGYHVVGTKSTVAPGTTEGLVLPMVEKRSGKKVGQDFGLAMIPEFLRQGQAVYDSFHPSRIIIGEYDERTGALVNRLYQGLRNEQGKKIPILHVEIKSAELIKYAANSLLATKISFANEFSRVCEKFNIDVYEVMKGVGLDFRVNPMFLNAGCGFGGSCFPKDVRAIVSLAEDLDVETPLLDAVLKTNDIQPRHLVDMVREVLGGDLNGKEIAILGLAFKPGTDDTRETRALPIINYLHREGAKIRVYDPRAYPKFKQMTDLPLVYTDSVEEALKEADCAIIQTEWEEIISLKPETFKELLKQPMVVDGRRSYDPEEMEKAGIIYRGVGWKNR